MTLFHVNRDLTGVPEETCSGKRSGSSTPAPQRARTPRSPGRLAPCVAAGSEIAPVVTLVSAATWTAAPERFGARSRRHPRLERPGDLGVRSFRSRRSALEASERPRSALALKEPSLAVRRCRVGNRPIRDTRFGSDANTRLPTRKRPRWLRSKRRSPVVMRRSPLVKEREKPLAPHAAPGCRA